MKKCILRLLLAASLMGVSSVALADLVSFLSSVNKQALSDIKKFNDKLSSQFGIPVPNVEAIVNSVPKPEDAFMILQLSQMSHQAPEVVLQKYQSDKSKGWGKLARELGIKPGSPEFHALKRGNLSFTGRSSGGAEGKATHNDSDKERDMGRDKSSDKNHGKDRKQDREKGQGKGHGKD